MPLAAHPQRAVLGVKFPERLGQRHVRGQVALELFKLSDGLGAPEHHRWLEEECSLEHGSVLFHPRANELVWVVEVLERLAQAEESDTAGGKVVVEAFVPLNRAEHLTQVEIEVQLGRGLGCDAAVAKAAVPA